MNTRDAACPDVTRHDAFNSPHRLIIQSSTPALVQTSLNSPLRFEKSLCYGKLNRVSTVLRNFGSQCSVISLYLSHISCRKTESTLLNFSWDPFLRSFNASPRILAAERAISDFPPKYCSTLTQLSVRRRVS